MNYTYDNNVDYSELMQAAVAAGNPQLAAIYEQQRNAKIRGESLQDQYPTTENYAQYLPSAQTDGAFGGMENSQKAISEIGKETFSYDPTQDSAFQAYRKQYLREADRGSRDVMGSYAAMTQGVPSTAAVTAAAQAGDYYRAQLADKVPELQSNAYSQWLNNQSLKLSQQELLRNGYNQMLDAQYNQSYLQYLKDNAANEQSYNRDYLQYLRDNAASNSQKTDIDYALSLLSMGILPSEELLTSTGLTADQAQGYLDSLKSSAYYSGGSSGSGSKSGETSGGKPVDWDTRRQLGELYQSGGMSAIAANVDYLAESGYDVDTLWNWIFTYYPHSPSGGYTGGTAQNSFEEYLKKIGQGVKDSLERLGDWWP